MTSTELDAAHAAGREFMLCMKKWDQKPDCNQWAAFQEWAVNKVEPSAFAYPAFHSAFDNGCRSAREDTP